MNKLVFNDICCVIITYNPEAGFLTLLETIKKQVSKVIIVDNNSQEKGLDIISSITSDENTILIRNPENLGIAKALNQGIIEAGNLKYNWVITFDQDSTPFDNIIEIISEVYTLYPEKNKIGAIGVNFALANNKSYYNFDSRKKYCEKDYLITSGCLMSVSAFRQVGGFREDFFIDNVDLEYSLRLRRNRKVSLISSKWGMRHKAGEPLTKEISGVKLISSNHSILRRYYMARNHVIMSREYFWIFPYFIAKLNFFFILALFKMVMVENEKGKKLSISLKGMKDGILYPSENKKYSE